MSPRLLPDGKRRCLTLREAARLLRVSTATVYRRCALGAIANVRGLNLDQDSGLSLPGSRRRRVAKTVKSIPVLWWLAQTPARLPQPS